MNLPSTDHCFRHNYNIKLFEPKIKKFEFVRTCLVIGFVDLNFKITGARPHLLRFVSFSDGRNDRWCLLSSPQIPQGT